MHNLVFFLLIVPFAALPQSATTRMGARAAAMGSAGMASADESALFQNPGAVAATERRPSTFFTSELAPSLIGANRTAVGITFHFGDEVYREQLLTAGFSHRRGTTSLGFKANMIQYRADGFGTRTAFTVDVGGLTQITPEWTVGAGIFNINQATLGPDEPLPVVFVAAVSWKAAGGPLLVLESEKRLYAPLCIKGGLEIGFQQKIFLRTGFSLQPLTLTAGIGTRTHRLALDFATSYNPVFTMMYQGSAGYRLGKRTAP
jgi:hypothetical protein